jgi:3-oxoadipate enol-lactonase
MPEFQLSPGVSLHYFDNDFTDPWREAEPIVLLHGYPENGLSWNAWVPHLARRFRVVRPDMRGFGRSTPMPIDYPWTVQGVVDDYMRLLDHLGIERFHLVSTQIGVAMGLRIATSCPQRVRTLVAVGVTVISGTFPSGRASAERREQFEREGGIEGWLRDTMPGRLGADCSPELVEGWIKLDAAAPLSSVLGFDGAVPGMLQYVSADLPRIACPTLIIATEEGKGAGLVESTQARAKMIPGAEVLLTPGDSRHPSASYPDACAAATLEFIERASVTKATKALM